MGLLHRIRLVVDSNYRKHHWLSKNLSKYRLVFKYIKTMSKVDFTVLNPEFSKLYLLAKKIEASREEHRKLTKEVRNARRR